MNKKLKQAGCFNGFEHVWKRSLDSSSKYNALYLNSQ